VVKTSIYETFIDKEIDTVLSTFDKFNPLGVLALLDILLIQYVFLSSDKVSRVAGDSF